MKVTIEIRVFAAVAVITCVAGMPVTAQQPAPAGAAAQAARPAPLRSPEIHYWFLWRDFLVHYAQITLC